jgi:MFS family permease
VFLLLVATFVIIAAVTFFIPETSPRTGFTSRQHLWRVLRPNAGLPPAVRGAFLAATPAMIAGWSLGGLYLSLGSSIVARILGLDNHMVAGLVIGAFFGAGGLGSVVASGWRASRKLAVGLSTLGVGLIISLIATMTANVPAYVIGSMLAGVGFGATFVGVMATLIAVTDTTDRGQVFSTMFIVSYTGFSVPAVIAGFAVIHVGLRPTAIGYGLFVLALAILAGATAIWRSRSDRQASITGAPTPNPDLVTAAVDIPDTSR